MKEFFQFFLAATLSWVAVLILLPYLKTLLLDTPNRRSSHLLPTPRGGGISFVIIGSILHLTFTEGTSRWLPIICLPLAIVGLIDDRFSLPAIWRYLIQLITALAVIFIAKISIPIWSIVLFLIFLTGIINFFNFMDGLDGLLAGCGFLLMSTTSSLALSGSIFGFLLWNWSPAKVFMGDVGSTFVGAVFGGIILQQTSYHDALSVFLLSFPLLGDAFVCLIRRLIKGDNIFLAHREHLFQRLNKAGWSHQRVAILYISATAILLMALKVGKLQLLLIITLVEISIAFYLDAKIAAKFGGS